MTRAASPKISSAGGREETDVRCVVCDLKEWIDGAELPEDLIPCELVLDDSVRGLRNN